MLDLGSVAGESLAGAGVISTILAVLLKHPRASREEGGDVELRKFSALPDRRRRRLLPYADEQVRLRSGESQRIVNVALEAADRCARAPARDRLVLLLEQMDTTSRRSLD